VAGCVSKSGLIKPVVKYRCRLQPHLPVFFTKHLILPFSQNEATFANKKAKAAIAKQAK